MYATFETSNGRVFFSGVFRMCERRGTGGLGDGSPLWGPGAKPPEADAFVTDCLNFDVLKKKN